jgi:hypothetical protein
VAPSMIARSHTLCRPGSYPNTVNDAAVIYVTTGRFNPQLAGVGPFDRMRWHRKPSSWRCRMAADVVLVSLRDATPFGISENRWVGRHKDRGSAQLAIRQNVLARKARHIRRRATRSLGCMARTRIRREPGRRLPRINGLRHRGLAVKQCVHPRRP